MNYAPPKLVLAAVSALNGTHPLAVVSIPALLRTAERAGVDPTVTPVEFGSGEESDLLREHFTLPRPPEPERPYLAPWTTGEWQKEKYPGGALQRQRTDLSGRGEVFIHSKGRPRDTWALTASAGADLMRVKSATQVRLIDLALWFGRNIDVDSLGVNVVGNAATPLDKLMAWFNHEFSPAKGDLVGTVYDNAIPSEYLNVSFSVDPVDDTTYQQLGSLPPAPEVQDTLSELVVKLEQRLIAGGYELPQGLVRRVLTAWMRGDIVILVGQPGTGKSLFASLLGRAMEAELDLNAPLLVPIRADFDEAEFIGYERLDGTPEYREFTTEVLQSDNPLEARVVVLEEFNLASIETYLSSVLIASQDKERLVRLPAGQQAHLPIDTFILATCNSYRDEPETRTRVSSPTKRRSTIITMPNVLGDRFDADPENAVLKVAINLIHAEQNKVRDRLTRSSPAQFDSLRSAGLATVTQLSDLSDGVKEALRAVCNAVLETDTGRSWFTLGILRDVVLNIVHADRDEESELSALGDAVADKIIHQLRGSMSDVEDLREAYAGLPNAAEIDRLVSRMTDGPSDELLSLL